tara:strand:+ start:262 stop:564 length:303 start_codon:yes stop_codon:yes gene_type:complete
MKLSNNTKKNVNQKIVKDQENAKYLMMLCNDKPNIILRTEFGIGQYKFIKFNELKGNLVLEFNLLENTQFKDTGQIYDNMGKTCFLSIEQYLYVYGSAIA